MHPIPHKYSGGYAIIDLGGIELPEFEELDKPAISGIFDKINSLLGKKTVFLSNAYVGTTPTSMYPVFPLQITGIYDDGSAVYASALADDGIMNIIVDDEDKISYQLVPFVPEP